MRSRERFIYMDKKLRKAIKELLTDERYDWSEQGEDSPAYPAAQVLVERMNDYRDGNAKEMDVKKTFTLWKNCYKRKGMFAE